MVFGPCCDRCDKLQFIPIWIGRGIQAIHVFAEGGIAKSAYSAQPSPKFRQYVRFEDSAPILSAILGSEILREMLPDENITCTQRTS
jgi:hypothetical protein